MTDFEKISHLIRFGLTAKKMTSKSVIDWADRKINEQNENSVFFDLSLADSANKIIEILSENIEWNFKDDEIRILILSYYKEYLDSNPTIWDEIERELLVYFELLEYDYDRDKPFSFIYYLEEDCCLREDGFGGLVNMPNYLIENLDEYKNNNLLKELLNKEGLEGYEIY
ncbi:MAG: hypothetical protein U0W24_08520 [Bacteroidales bacterium]